MRRRDFLGISLATGLAAVSRTSSGSGRPLIFPRSQGSEGLQTARGSNGAPFSIGLHAQLPLPRNGRQLARLRDGGWLFTYASHTDRDRAGNYTGATDIRVRASRVTAPINVGDFGPEHVLVRRPSTAYFSGTFQAETGGYVIRAEGAADVGTKPSIVIDGKDVLHLAWVRSGAGEVWYSRCDISSPGAFQALGHTKAWCLADGETVGGERISAEGADLGDICLDGQGRPCLVYENVKGIFFSRYEGGRWKEKLLAPGPGLRWPMMACDARGRLHVVFVSRGRRASGLLHYLRSEDGVSWGGATARTVEPDLIGGYCSEQPSLAVCGEHILVAHYQGYRVVTFSHYDGQRWRENTVVEGSYEHTSPALTVDRHGVIWLHMVSRLHDWSMTSRWLGKKWGDVQQGRHLKGLAQTCSAERVMLPEADEFGILLADQSHRLHFDTFRVPAPTTEKGSRLMFLDLWEVAALEGVQQVVEPMEKDPRNPVLRHGEPGSWDGEQANLQGTILKEGDRYRMWYTGLDKKPYYHFNSACGYAESTDGVNWAKPNLGLYAYGGNKNNNICFPYGFHFLVLRMPEDFERGLDKRYRMAFTSENVLLAFSRDGIRWRLSEENPIWYTAAETRCQWCGVDNVIYIYDPLDPNPDRRFKAYPQVSLGDKSRVTGLLFSPNGIHFTEYSNNPVIDADLGVERQHHMIEVCWQRHGLFIGLYGCYLDNVNLDARLAVSRDGIHWVTVKNEVPFLPTGKPGTWDAGMVFPANYPVIDEEEVWIYYSGYEFNFTAGEGHASVGRARVRLDGFARMQLEAGHAEGSLTTVPFEARDLDNARLVVNADGLAAGKDALRVEVLDHTSGEVLPGFEAQACLPLAQDGVAIPVTWRNHPDLSDVDRKRIRFRFVFAGSDAAPRLYSFGFD